MRGFGETILVDGLSVKGIWMRYNKAVLGEKVGIGSEYREDELCCQVEVDYREEKRGMLMGRRVGMEMEELVRREFETC